MDIGDDERQEQLAANDMLLQGLLQNEGVSLKGKPSTSFTFNLKGSVDNVVFLHERNVLHMYSGSSAENPEKKAKIYLQTSSKKTKSLSERVHVLDKYIPLFMMFFEEHLLSSVLTFSEQLKCMDLLRACMEHTTFTCLTKDYSRMFHFTCREFLQAKSSDGYYTSYAFDLKSNVERLREWCDSQWCSKHAGARRCNENEMAGYMSLLMTDLEKDLDQLTHVDVHAVKKSHSLKTGEFDACNVGYLKRARVNCRFRKDLSTTLLDVLKDKNDQHAFFELTWDKVQESKLVFFKSKKRLAVFKQQSFLNAAQHYCCIYTEVEDKSKWKVQETNILLQHGKIMDFVFFMGGGNRFAYLSNSQLWTAEVNDKKHVKSNVKGSQLLSIPNYSKAFCIVSSTEMKSVAFEKKTMQITTVVKCSAPILQGAICSLQNDCYCVAVLLNSGLLQLHMVELQRASFKLTPIASCEKKFCISPFDYAKVKAEHIGLRSLGLRYEQQHIVVSCCYGGVAHEMQVQLDDTLKMLPHKWNHVMHTTCKDFYAVTPEQCHGITRSGETVVKQYKSKVGTCSADTIYRKNFCGGIAMPHGEKVKVVYDDNTVHIFDSLPFRLQNGEGGIARCCNCMVLMDRISMNETCQDLCHVCEQNLQKIHYREPLAYKTTATVAQNVTVNVLKPTWKQPCCDALVLRHGPVYIVKLTWKNVVFGTWDSALTVKATRSDLMTMDYSKCLKAYIQFRKSEFFCANSYVFTDLDDTRPTEAQIVNTLCDIEDAMDVYKCHPIMQAATGDLVSAFSALLSAVQENPGQAFMVTSDALKTHGSKKVRFMFQVPQLQAFYNKICSCQRALKKRYPKCNFGTAVSPRKRGPQAQVLQEALVGRQRPEQNEFVNFDEYAQKTFLFTGTLLPQQRDAEAAFFNGTSCRSGCLEAVMAFGKTIWGLHIASVIGWRALIIVPSQEDVDQYREELHRHFVNEDGSSVAIKLLSQQHIPSNVSENVCICTYATLRMAGFAAKWSTFFHLTLADEVHHAVNEDGKTQQALRELRARVIVGYSGTPYTQNSNITSFLPILKTVTLKDMEAKLCLPDYVKIQFPKYTGGRKDHPLRPEVIQFLKCIMRKFSNVPKLFMFEHKLVLEKVALQLHLPFVHGGTSASLRRKLIGDMRNGKIMTLVCGKNMWEGVNMPPATIAVRLEHNDSLQQNLQINGRVFRPHKDKDASMVIDASNSSLEQFQKYGVDSGAEIIRLQSSDCV